MTDGDEPHTAAFTQSINGIGDGIALISGNAEDVADIFLDKTMN
jgi:hypothetical protein